MTGWVAPLYWVLLAPPATPSHDCQQWFQVLPNVHWGDKISPLVENHRYGRTLFLAWWCFLGFGDNCFSWVSSFILTAPFTLLCWFLSPWLLNVHTCLLNSTLVCPNDYQTSSLSFLVDISNLICLDERTDLCFTRPSPLAAASFHLLAPPVV